MEAAGWILAAAIGLGGLFALRRAWSLGPARPRLAWLLSGWAGLAACLTGAALLGGVDRGSVIGACAVMVLACALIGATAEIREAKARKTRITEALDPLARPRRPWRAVWRALTAALLASTAALALGAAFATAMPMRAIDRQLIAAWTTPLIWGAAVVWALADERLLRPTLALAAVTGLGAAIAIFMGRTGA